MNMKIVVINGQNHRNNKLFYDSLTLPYFTAASVCVKCKVSLVAHILSARHTSQASRLIGGTKVRGNICLNIILHSTKFKSTSWRAFKNALFGWVNP